MNEIRNKLRSSRGASITYALLIFLVCAVVSAVVIVAATTSSGRMSELAAMDQRYYAVNSAAELLCDVFVAPSTTQPPEVTLTYKTSDGSVTTVTTITDVLVLDADERLAKALVTRTDAAPVVLNLTSEGNDPLNCTITETVYSNGLMEFAISNVDTKNAYKLIVTLASDVKRVSTGDASTEQIIVKGWKLHSIRKYRADELLATSGGD